MGARKNLFTEDIGKPTVQRRVRKWIKALRSGEYLQTTGQLRSLESVGKKKQEWAYCCLGVACNLVDPEGWDEGGHKLGTSRDPKKPSDEIDANDSLLSIKGLEKFGLRITANGFLSKWNDGGAPFEEIADRLDKDMKEALSV